MVWMTCASTVVLLNVDVGFSLFPQFFSLSFFDAKTRETRRWYFQIIRLAPKSTAKIENESSFPPDRLPFHFRHGIGVGGVCECHGNANEISSHSIHLFHVQPYRLCFVDMMSVDWSVYDSKCRRLNDWKNSEDGTCCVCVPTMLVSIHT